jgi:hypothetical protein
MVAGVCYLAGELVAQYKWDLHIEAAITAVGVVMHVRAADAGSSQANQHLVRIERRHLHLLLP